jgi:hypothetical protein
MTERKLLGCLLALAGLALRAGLPTGHAAEPIAPTAPPSPKPAVVPGGEIFEEPTVLDFQLQLARTNFAALRERPREYVPVTVVVNGQGFTNVGVKLKGAAGSFRPVDDRPALTLSFSRWAAGRRLFGLRRLHLNNSVQDHSRLNEYLGSELFRAAGIPTPRVAWATVRINDRPLGLYVLKEAFEVEFLRLYFGSAAGNLYDGGFVRDIDGDLVKESGLGPDDRADLKALLAAVHESDAARRWERLQQVLDVDRFATYAALSVMLADWDGYPLNRNNYRIYFRPGDRRAVFLPHGMDQLFQRNYLELDSNWAGCVAWGVFGTPPGQQLYQERCRKVFAEVFRLERMTNTIARAVKVLKTVEPGIADSARWLADQVESRHRTLAREKWLQPASPPAVSGSATPSTAAGPAGR